MICNSFRNVPSQSLMTMVPYPYERARFMSLQSSVQHLATAIGAFASASILREGPNDTLVGMHTVALIAMIMAVISPIFLFKIQAFVKNRDALLAIKSHNS